VVKPGDLCVCHIDFFLILIAHHYIQIPCHCLQFLSSREALRLWRRSCETSEATALLDLLGMGMKGRKERWPRWAVAEPSRSVLFDLDVFASWCLEAECRLHCAGERRACLEQQCHPPRIHDPRRISGNDSHRRLSACILLPSLQEIAPWS
jgi:hypothetical protein